MKVFVNDREVTPPSDTAQTVHSLVEDLRTRQELPVAEAVSEVKLNDEVWKARDLPEALERTLDGLSCVRILTSDLREYALEILSESGGILDVLITRTHEVAAAFRTSETTTANVRLYRLLDAVQRFLVCLCALQNACAQELRPLDGEQDTLTNVARSLERIEENQYSEDWEGLARNLDEYLHPALKELSGTITALQENV